MAMTPVSDDGIMIPQGDYSPVVKDRINRLKREADRLFSLGGVRKRCQAVLFFNHLNQQPSSFSDWGVVHSNDTEYLFAWNLTMTYQSTKYDIVQWASGCMSEYLLKEVAEEREKRIVEFARMKITSRWYQMRDDEVAWRVFSKNIPFNKLGRENEINDFFRLLDQICILTDILLGHASEYGLEVDYNKQDTPIVGMCQNNDGYNVKLSASRKSVFDRLQLLIDKGEWVNGISSDAVKSMMKSVLGLDETPLDKKMEDLSEMLWQLLESGRGDRVKIVWQNLVGYFDDKKMFKIKGSPSLNKDFFGTEENYSNIDKGRPSRDNMSSGFREILPLLDAFIPKIG